MNYNNLSGDQIRACRKAWKMPIREFALYIDVHAVTLNRWELKKHQVPCIESREVAKVLKAFYDVKIGGTR